MKPPDARFVAGGVLALGLWAVATVSFADGATAVSLWRSVQLCGAIFVAAWLVGAIIHREGERNPPRASAD